MPTLTICTDLLPCASLEEALTSARRIDWWSGETEAMRACSLSWAADSLRRLLGRHPAFAADSIGICGPDRLPPVTEEGLRISLSAPVARAAEEWYSLTGRRNRGGVEVAVRGADRRCAIWATFALLERLGFGFHAPGDGGTALDPDRLRPRREILEELAALQISESPAYELRGCYSEYMDDSASAAMDWMAANRANLCLFPAFTDPWSLKMRGLDAAGGVHEILYRFIDPRAEYPYRHAAWGRPGDASREPDPYPASPAFRSPREGTLTYSDAHPEWYPLVGGERRFDRSSDPKNEGYVGVNFCTSNAEALRELCRRLVEDLAGGVYRHLDVLYFCMLDNGLWCQCPDCAAQGNETARQIAVVHAVRTAILQARGSGRLGRDVRILFPAYHETLPVPDRPMPEGFDYGACYLVFTPIERCYLHALEDPRCTESNQELLRVLEPWVGESSPYRGKLFIGEYYNISSFASLPLPLTRIIAADLPAYHARGARGFYSMHLTPGRWGTNALKYWLHLRLLWNPASDAEALVRDYLRARYGRAAVPMAGFYGALEDAMANMKALFHYQGHRGRRYFFPGMLNQDREELFPLRHFAYDLRADDPNAGISLSETWVAMATCRRLLARAILACQDPEVAGRLAEDEMRFAYGEAFVSFRYWHATALLCRRRGDSVMFRRSLRQASRWADLLEGMEEPLLDQKGWWDFYENGLTATMCRDAFRTLERAERETTGREAAPRP
jgi:hypothetical protein